MSLPIEHAHKVVQSMEVDAIRNFVAQAKAKQILREVHEIQENYPEFSSDLDDRVTFLAYRLLAAGCSLIEQGELVVGYTELQSAADILESAHRTEVANNEVSSFHCLIAAMAFYACGQYSRAFVTVRNIETVTSVASIIAAFLRKNTKQLISSLNNVLLAEQKEYEDSRELDEWALTICLARAVSLILEHGLSGRNAYLEDANSILQDAMIISESGSNPAYWWLSRLLKLMLGDYQKGSLWIVIPPYFGPGGIDVVEDYVRLLAFSAPPVTELWQSQLVSLPLTLDKENHGGVINLRTSAGKTRVAELAILQTLRKNPEAKVLYLAPFRSLAFELERTFAKTLSELGFSISHLYGGTRFSRVDRELVIEASITIATPEKAKAMLRAAPELFDSVKLIVVDEGHLLGRSERDVRNEIFLEHLRLLARQRGARMLLLSAVLPNADELATWIGGDPQALAQSDWKPSAERFGLLRWTRGGVQIEWRGEEPCYNPHFVEFSQVIDEGRKSSRRFPKTKTEAVAATAVRLAEIGPVLIFAGQAQWLPSMVRSVLLAFGENAPVHEWPQTEWNIFEAVCKEELGEECLELNAARVGIVSHSNKLPPQVRISIEKMMAKCPPKIIVATTTLGQGVNIGISTVIVSTTYIGNRRQISKRDFWNICGRAGRAFVDGEGKVLFAIDNTRGARQVRRDEGIAESYLDISNLDKVMSGLLEVSRILQNIAYESDISFELLLELVANNNFEPFGGNQRNVSALLDMIDDELLALYLMYRDANDEQPVLDWVDDAFRESLALIQEINDLEEDEQPVISNVLKARIAGVLHEVSTPQARRSIVVSGLPLSVGLVAYDQLGMFRGMVDQYLESGENLEALVNLVREFENWARENATVITENIPEQELLDNIRTRWIEGLALRSIVETCGENSHKICRDLYGYQLPWLFHSIAQKFDWIQDNHRMEALAKVGLLVELGLPSEAAAKVFLAGIRSRSAAVELAAYVTDPAASIRRIRSALLNPDTIAALSTVVSNSTIEWLNMLSSEFYSPVENLVRCSSFQSDVPDGIEVLHVRQKSEQEAVYLCSSDTRHKFVVGSSDEMPFNKLANDPRNIFVRDGNVWHQRCRDPRVTIAESNN